MQKTAAHNTQLLMQLFTQMLTARNCSLDATAHATAHATARCTQLITQLLTSGTCSVDATAHATAPWMRRLTHLLRGCDGSLHASGGLRGVDRGLQSVRSARGLQGRQELELLTPGATHILRPQRGTTGWRARSLSRSLGESGIGSRHT